MPSRAPAQAMRVRSVRASIGDRGEESGRRRWCPDDQRTASPTFRFSADAGQPRRRWRRCPVTGRARRDRVPLRPRLDRLDRLEGLRCSPGPGMLCTRRPAGTRHRGRGRPAAIEPGWAAVPGRRSSGIAGGGSSAKASSGLGRDAGAQPVADELAELLQRDALAARCAGTTRGRCALVEGRARRRRPPTRRSAPIVKSSSSRVRSRASAGRSASASPAMQRARKSA